MSYAGYIIEQIIDTERKINESFPNEIDLRNFLSENIFKAMQENRNKSNNNMKMPDIKNYTYNNEIGLTTIEWSDGTKTTTRAENILTADCYTGFVTAYAKKAAGNNNTINNLFDEWVIEKPKKAAELKAKKERMLAENRAKEERNRKKREKSLIRREAIRLKREHEAKKLAFEKYNVPIDEEC